MIIIINRKESTIQCAKEQINFSYAGSVCCFLLMCSSVLMVYFSAEFIYENEFSPKIISYFEKKTSFTNLGCPSLFARLAKLYFLPFLSLQEHRNNSASLEKGRQCWSIVWVLKAGSRGMELNRKAKHIRHRIQLGKGIPSKTQEEEKNNKNLVLVCIMHASGWFWFDCSGGGGGVLKSYFLPF